MGNLLATSSVSKATESAAGEFADPPCVPQPEAQPASDSDASATTKEDKPNLLGSFTDLHKRCKELQAVPFEGAKIILNRSLRDNFQVTHTLHMSTIRPGGYRFGATYVGSKPYGLSEMYPVLYGDIDPAGNLNATIMHQLTSGLRCKYVAHIQDATVVSSHIGTDYRGEDFTASLSLDNPNIANRSCTAVAQYLQSVSNHLALGAELIYLYNPQEPGQIAGIATGARYELDDAVWTGKFSPNGVQLCYYQQASNQLQIGVELDTDLRKPESIATIAYKVNLPKADLVFRGFIDTECNICSVLEKRLLPSPLVLALSGHLNQPKNTFRIGCGLMIG